MPELLGIEVVDFVQRLHGTTSSRSRASPKPLDWAAALTALGGTRLDAEQVEQTLGVLLKLHEDVGMMRNGGARGVLAELQAGPPVNEP